jgi:hypothetical protein
LQIGQHGRQQAATDRILQLAEAQHELIEILASVTFPVGRGWFLPDPFVKNLLL